MSRYNVKPYLFDGYWADVGTIGSFYEANVTLGLPDAPFRYWDPAQPIYTHLRHLPGSRLLDCQMRDSILAEGCYLDRVRVDQSVVGLRTNVRSGTHIDHSVILGADIVRGRRRRRACRRSASAATSCCAASSSTRTPASATARGSPTSAASRRPTATAITSAAGSSSCRRAA